MDFRDREILTRNTMMAPLLKADPSLLVEWNAFLADWGDMEPPPHSFFTGRLAEYLGKRLEIGHTEAFQNVFNVLEEWIRLGDAYVQEMVNEVLTDLAIWGDEIYLTWLGPEGRQKWLALRELHGKPE